MSKRKIEHMDLGGGRRGRRINMQALDIYCSRWSEFDRGWLSALVDGEGSISLLKQRRPTYKAGYTYEARLNISNNDRRLLDKAQSLFGTGPIHGPNKQGLYQLNLAPNACRVILPKLYLIAKKGQQKLILEALNILSNHHSGPGNPRPEEEIQQLERIRFEIRKLNGTLNRKYPRKYLKGAECIKQK